MNQPPNQNQPPPIQVIILMTLARLQFTQSLNILLDLGLPRQKILDELLDPLIKARMVATNQQPTEEKQQPCLHLGWIRREMPCPGCGATLKGTAG